MNIKITGNYSVIERPEGWVLFPNAYKMNLARYKKNQLVSPILTQTQEKSLKKEMERILENYEKLENHLLNKKYGPKHLTLLFDHNYQKVLEVKNLIKLAIDALYLQYEIKTRPPSSFRIENLLLYSSTAFLVAFKNRNDALSLAEEAGSISSDILEDIKYFSKKYPLVLRDRSDSLRDLIYLLIYMEFLDPLIKKQKSTSKEAHIATRRRCERAINRAIKRIKDENIKFVKFKKQ